MTKASADDFFDLMECYQLADQLDPSLKQQNQSKNDKDDTKKSTEKLNDKKHKAQMKKDDSNAPVPKKSCLIHGPDSSHTTNECRTMREQAYRMKEAWKNIPQAEQSHQKCECEQQKKKDQNELYDNFDGQTMTWDKSTIKMKEYKDLLDINSPINECYQQEEIYESQALIDASSHLKRNIRHKVRASRP
jgi:hypothetical protein